MSEYLYDNAIAPKLKEIAELCQRAGMPFVAFCEYEPGKHSRTEFVPESASIQTHIAAIAARCDANVDGMMIAIARRCARTGIDTSGSIYLGQHHGDLKP